MGSGGMWMSFNDVGVSLSNSFNVESTASNNPFSFI